MSPDECRAFEDREQQQRKQRRQETRDRPGPQNDQTHIEQHEQLDRGRFAGQPPAKSRHSHGAQQQREKRTPNVDLNAHQTCRREQYPNQVGCEDAHLLGGRKIEQHVPTLIVQAGVISVPMRLNLPRGPLS